MKNLLATTSLAVSLLLPLGAKAFESGSTGADGAFNPTADTQLTLPPSGIFNFTDVTIPTGVTVTFTKNAANTPVYILASGDITIEGTISINGGNGGGHGDGARGIGGPGGFDGGHGGLRSDWGSSAATGEAGFGPGGGNPGTSSSGYGRGGGFATRGYLSGGTTYGESHLRTLIGGSGGGGAYGSSALAPGGGGGAGAILLAASGTINISGAVTAIGGDGGTRVNDYAAPGSGGAIRIVATTVEGNGTLAAYQGDRAPGLNAGTNDGKGRIRVEAQNMLRTASSNPAFSYSQPYPAFYSTTPSLSISAIGGQTVPSSPTGFQDVNLDGVTSNPITVDFTTSNIPLGTQITLRVLPERGSPATHTTTGVTGSETSGSDTIDINLPNGNATLFAYTSYTIQLAQNQQELYTQYAQGEAVEEVRFDVDSNGQASTTFITLSGNEYTWASSQVQLH